MSAGEFVNHLSEPVKHTVDVLSIGALLTTLVGWVPEVTAVLVLIWTLMRMYGAYLDNQLKRRALRDSVQSALRRSYQGTVAEGVKPTERELLDRLK